MRRDSDTGRGPLASAPNRGEAHGVFALQTHTMPGNARHARHARHDACVAMYNGALLCAQSPCTIPDSGLDKAGEATLEFLHASHVTLHSEIGRKNRPTSSLPSSSSTASAYDWEYDSEFKPTRSTSVRGTGGYTQRSTACAAEAKRCVI